MATSAHRLIQDQNLNLLYNAGTTPGGKTDMAKADKKGGLGGRKALNDISNSRKPSVLQPTKKDKSTNVIAIEKDPFAAKAKFSKAPEKGKNGGRKALSDLTNSVKPSTQQVPTTGRKLKTVAEEKVPSSMMDERFLHNHQECIKAQMKGVDVDYFLKSVGLNNDISAKPSAMRALQSSSKKHFEMEEIPEQLFEDQLPLSYSPACRSPKSPRPPYVNWDDENFCDLMVVETPKLLYP
ncbi:hypothetical protein BUALT_Bualt06G0105700 [Buddleja alternifolia]|uniref:Uncharacterized protein n=1 Tax=Buddleja alternifolia TaxID=168488 RepID=A0AAV6XEB1_9LAMI|nr:hypothetical protein BUALT_Bualt06G0105700 [Buddleja alternifolia]